MDFTKDSIESSMIVHDYEAGQYSVDGSQTVRELSAWEKWIIRKAQMDRAKAEQEQLLRRKEKEGAKVSRRTQREKKRKSEHVYREWLADKAKKEADHIQRERSDVKQRLEDIEKKKCGIEDKSKAGYNEWRAKKKEEKIAREKLKFEEQEGKAALAQEKRERGAKAYRNWMRVNYNRQVETDWYSRLDEKRTFLHSCK